MPGEMVITANDVDVQGFAFGVFASGLPLEYNFPFNGQFVPQWSVAFGGFHVRFADQPTLDPGPNQFSLDGFSFATSGPLHFHTFINNALVEVATATMPTFSYTSNFAAGDGAQAISANVFRLFVNPQPFEAFIESLDRIVFQGSDADNAFDASHHLTNMFMDGGGGNDFLIGSFHHHSEIFGGAGNDALRGRGVNDLLDGGDGDDTVYDQDGVQDLDGNRFFDADTLIGGTGNDQLISFGGDDFMDGGAGNDSLSSNGLVGVTGSVTQVGGAGNDIITGGASRTDTAVYSGKRSDYSIANNSPFGADFLRIVDLRPNSPDHPNDGTDDVSGVDFFSFANGTVTVTNISDQEPTITSNGAGATAAIAVNENTSAVTQVVTIDPDLGQTLVYSIIPASSSGGADAGKFQLDPSTGVLSFVAAPDFENPTDTGADNGYEVTVRVTDEDGLFDEQVITAHVTNVPGFFIIGTEGADVISTSSAPGGQPFASGEEDTISGLAGNDTLVGGTGDDVVFAGAGSDVVQGGDGNDTLVGNADILASEADTLDGGNGSDTIYAENTDTVQGGADRDFLYVVNSNPFTINLGATSIEWIQSDFGNDNIDGSSQTIGIEVYSDGGNDTIIGSSFNDIIWSGSGNDTVNAGAGTDVIVGDIGADSLSGGEGDDSIYVDASDTSIDGGAGFDAAYITGGAGLLINMAATHFEWAADFVGGNDTIDASGLGTRAEVYAQGGTDIVTGGSGADFLWGGAGNDIVTGNVGDDVLVGETGMDTLTGGSGIDALYGNSGNGGDGVQDRFVFTAGWGTDFVFDFEHGIDKIDMSALGIALEDLTVTTAGPHAHIAFGGNLISIANAGGVMDAGDFIF